MSQVRVRFAPSPTGSLHIGGARTALFNWLFARRHGGRFILRVEDTDAGRSTEEAAEGIAAALTWLGIDWDEGPGRPGDHGPYFQSQRRDLYREAAARLLKAGRAYRCYCTPEELAERREAARRQGRVPRYDGRCRGLTPVDWAGLEAEGRTPAVRLRVPETGAVTVQDIVRGEVTFDCAVLDDFILVKSDGMPAYNFACVVDDTTMAVSHVIRGEEHLSNTPKQILIYQALDYALPHFAHLPMILAPDRAKLSKRHGATSVQEFADAGYLPDALINYLALLGWSPQDETEVFARDELVARFSLDRVARTAAVYDTQKLTWFNAQYMRALPAAQLAARVRPLLEERDWVPESHGYDPDWLAAAVTAFAERARTLNELADALAYFFVADDQVDYDEKGYKKHLTRPGAADLLRAAVEAVEAVGPFNAEALEGQFRRLAERLEIKTSPLFHACRVAISGRTVGPGLFDIMVLLGRGRTRARLQAAAGRVQAAAGESESGY